MAPRGARICRRATRSTEVVDVGMQVVDAAVKAVEQGDTRTTRVRWEPQEEGVMRTAASFPSV
jgi:hypothetical protein